MITLFTLFALAMAEPDSGRLSALMAAVNSANMTGSRRCIASSLSPITRKEFDQVLSLPQVGKAGPTSLRAELTISQSERAISESEKLRFKERGWQVVADKNIKMFGACDVLVRVSNPILGEKFGVVSVSLTKPNSNVFYIYSLVLERAEYGWRVVASTEEHILAI